MSKKFKGKLCVYCCDAPSTTKDHIFAREFFLMPRRQHLPTVPACKNCNDQKSQLEHYLASVLPFGGRHADAAENLKTMTPKRLDKNPRVLTALGAAFQIPTRRGWERADGLLLPAVGFAFDGQKFEHWIAMLVKGLSWYHWRELVTPDCVIDVRWGHESVFERLLTMPAARRISENVGAGTFLYEATQGIDSPKVSVWRFSVYGGARFGLSGVALRETGSEVGVLAGPKSMLDREEKRLMWLIGQPERQTV
jgi:hypothetical protein